jgi:Fe-S-cluster-containing dehydrogenase component
MNMKRRDFLKGLGVGAAVSTLPARASAKTSPKGEDLATLLDLSKCIGCGACVEACREAGEAKFPEPEKPFPKMFPPRVKVSDWSDKRDVDDRLTPYNYLFIQSLAVEHGGESHELHVPRRCMHCVNPPCAKLCPWGAAAKLDKGIVHINDALCLGGSKCAKVCPWDIPQRQSGVGPYLDLLPRFAGNGVMYKCDRCKDLVALGDVPACISACPEDVQKIGPRSQIIAEARELAAGMGGYLYGADENGGTNTIYVSPVPFEKVQAALQEAQETGPGRPHLSAVEDVMADQSMLAGAVVAAPLAAAAVSLTTLGREIGKIEERDSAPSASPIPWEKWAWRVTMFMLALTGFGQMPVFKRYYVADIPGLAWTGDFHITSVLHLAFGAVFLFLLTRRALGKVKMPKAMWSVLGVLGLTGLTLAVKNLAWVWLPPNLITAVDLTHLFAAMVLGGVALWGLCRTTKG